MDPRYLFITSLLVDVSFKSTCVEKYITFELTFVSVIGSTEWLCQKISLYFPPKV